MKGNHNGLRLVVVALLSYLLGLVKSHGFAELARWAFRDSKKLNFFVRSVRKVSWGISNPKPCRNDFCHFVYGEMTCPTASQEKLNFLRFFVRSVHKHSWGDF